MSIQSNSSRRTFLKQSLIAGGGLLIGFNLGNSKLAAQGAIGNAAITSAATDFNSYLSIGSDGLITIFSPNPEIGQNIKTSFPMIVADELDVDWEKVQILQAPLDNQKFERQVTGGSGAIPHSWKRLREAGATARQMLVEAAARRWKVPANELSTADSMVIHKASGRKLSYGALAAEAASLPVPADVKLKDPKDFKLIGKEVKNVDNRDIITGKPLFGIDFYREGMLTAMVQRPPAFGMKIKSVDAAAAKGMPGIVDVITFHNKVAIVGKSTWQISKARKALKVSYEKEEALESSSDHDRLFKELLDSPEATIRRKDGDVEQAFKKAAKVVKSEYQCPFLPHSPLEPMNFFAHVRPDGVELVGPTQTPDRARGVASEITGFPPEKISVEMTRMGGAFGRRLMADFVAEAVEVSKLAKAPVKLIWSREDDMTGGNYRPAVRYRFEAALDEQGNMIGYKLRGVGINSGNPTREDNFPSGSVEHLLIDSVEHKSPISTAPWRAPITNFLAFAEQAFIDEVAREAAKDPIQFRIELMEKAQKSPVGKIGYDIDRMKKVSQLVAEKAGWGKKKGVYQGFSVYYSHLSYVAQIGEVVLEAGKPVVKKIYAVADCGQVVNLSGARQQVIGGIVDGFGHAMFGKLSFNEGEPEQKNFHNYRLIRLSDVPEVEVHFVDNGIDPTGLGEPALPPTGAAVANAIFQATNKRIYHQPFTDQEALKGTS